jgi:O-antigen/teichoic acid export membrane protein
MIRNILSTFVTRSLVAAFNLAILLVASRHLGSAVWGEVSLLILNLAIIQTINDIYTGSAMVYFIPRSNLRRIYRTGLVWTLFCIILVNTGFYIFNVGLKDQWIHVLIISFMITVHAFHNILLLATEKIWMYNFLQFLQPALVFIVLSINIFIIDMQTVIAYITALYVSLAFSLLVSLTWIVLALREPPRADGEFNPFQIFKNGLTNELGNLAHTLSNRFNYYMLQANIVLVGIFASGSSLIESVWLISGSISPVVLTYIANRAHVPENARITFLLSKISLLLGLAGVTVLYFIPGEFFTWLLGPDFSGVKRVMLLLSPGILCISFSSIISHYYSGQGRQKILLTANACGLSVTLFTSYFFITRYGIAGACYAAALSYATQSLVLVISFMKNNALNFRELFSFRKDLALLK